MSLKRDTTPTSSKKPPARDRLLHAASKLFFERGYTNVGIDEIIRESGVAKATFYTHFPSKELLVEAWLQKIHDDSIKHQIEVLNAPGKTCKKIANSFDELKLHLESNDFRGCPYSNSCVVTDSECMLIRDQIESHKEAAREFYFRLSLRETTDRKLARKMADQIFLLYSGATTEAQNLRSSWPVELAKETALMICQKTFD